MHITVSEEEKAIWFDWADGNLDLVEICEMFAVMTHTWDDLIDRDKPVSQEAINEAFKIALVCLPNNKLYQAFLPQLLPLWVAVISAYETANKFEQNKDEHGIEIAHSLKCALGHIMAFLMLAIMPKDRSDVNIPKMWKSFMDERYDDYRKEHLND